MNRQTCQLALIVLVVGCTEVDPTPSTQSASAGVLSAIASEAPEEEPAGAVGSIEPAFVLRRSGKEHGPMVLAFTPDSKQLLAGDAKGGVELFDLDKRAPAALHPRMREATSADSLAFTPEGTLLSHSRAGDVALRTLHPPPTKDDASLWSATVPPTAAGAFDISPDGKRGVFGGTVWDLVKNQRVVELARVEPTAVAFYDEGASVLAANAEARPEGPPCGIDRFDATTGKIIDVLAEGVCVSAMDVADKSHRAAALTTDMTIRTWDLRTGKELATLVLDSEKPEHLALMADGRVAITGGGALCYWDLERRARIACSTAIPEVHNPLLSPDESMLAVSAGNDAVALFQVPPRQSMDLSSAATPPLAAAERARAELPAPPAYATTATWARRPDAAAPKGPAPDKSAKLLTSQSGRLTLGATSDTYAYSVLSADPPGILRTPLEGGASELLEVGTGIQIVGLAVTKDRLYFIDRPRLRARRVLGATFEGRLASVPLRGGPIDLVASLPPSAHGLTVSSSDLVWCTKDDRKLDASTDKVEAVPGGVFRLAKGSTSPKRAQDAAAQCPAFRTDDLLWSDQSDGTSALWLLKSQTTSK